MSFKEHFTVNVRDLRKRLKSMELDVYCLHEEGSRIPPDPQINQGEIHANLTLAYRHLEDARMRLGKVIQYCEGGESAYDTRPSDQRGPLS